MLEINRTTSNNLDFQFLVQELDAYLAIRNGEEDVFFKQFNKIDALKNAVVVYKDEPIACGAFKEYDSETVEIKRMYTRPNQRGQGIAQSVLKSLENWAAELGFSYAILETGKDMTSAVRLYQKSGYEVIPNYPPYTEIETSFCLKKRLRTYELD